MMKLFAPMFTVAASLTLATPCLSQSREVLMTEPIPTELAGDDDARQGIAHLRADWNAALQASDVDRLLELVTDDVVFLPPGTPALHGKPAVEALYQSLFSLYRIEQEASSDELIVAGDWAVDIGHETTRIVPLAEGEPVTLQGKGVAVLRRGSDGHWRFARAINNLDAPLGAQPAADELDER